MGHNFLGESMSEKSKKKSSAKKVKTKSVDSFKNRIITTLTVIDKKTVPISQLESKCRSKKYGSANFQEAFAQLRREGRIIVRKGKKVGLTERSGAMPATVTRLSRTFGFARTDDGVEYFIPGKCMLGAMPEDRVLISDIESRSGEPEGEVVDILSFGSNTMTGVVEVIDDKPYLVPDTASNSHLIIVKQESLPFREGDKVLCEIVYRGQRHAEHKVRVCGVFGSSGEAKSCAEAILAAHGVEKEFPDDVLREANKISEGGVREFALNNREDLRDMPIFTIDSAYSKDLDDAVSVERTENGWLLGVHIADVSNYVKGNSALDKEALRRGTSIYYADRVIPMLPKELSNGICSLNPNEDRLTLSVFITLDSHGEIEGYRFSKSVIRSRVKGVYSEVNAIIDGSADSELRDKYSSVIGEIPVMDELAEVLIRKREARHSPEIETVEGVLEIDENGVCVGIRARERGRSERIIEEFMLCANECAARLAREKNVPFVYRVHEAPPEEKVEALREILPKYQLECPDFAEFKPVHAAEILKKAKGTDSFEAVNMLVLRSMAKARYSNEPLGHFSLVLENYAHFTSPIRRYPDLAIHRIITDILAGYSEEWLSKRYSGFVQNASERSSAAELRAVSIERSCEDCYKAEFMRAHIGESFTAKISGVTEYGFYALLPDTIEGLVHIHELPEGEYDYTEPVALTERFSGVSYTIGKEVRVICIAADVNSGKIDFTLDDEQEN